MKEIKSRKVYQIYDKSSSCRLAIADNESGVRCIYEIDKRHFETIMSIIDKCPKMEIYRELI